MYYYYLLVYCSSVWVGLTNDSRFGPSILPGSNNLKPTFGRLYHPMAMLCRCDRGFTNRSVNWMGTLQVLNYRLVVLSCKVFISARAAPKSNFLTEVWSSAVEVLLAILSDIATTSESLWMSEVWIWNGYFAAEIQSQNFYHRAVFLFFCLSGDHGCFYFVENCSGCNSSLCNYLLIRPWPRVYLR